MSDGAGLFLRLYAYRATSLGPIAAQLGQALAEGQIAYDQEGDPAALVAAAQVVEWFLANVPAAGEVTE